jgi:hypothetical protein
MAVEVVHSWLRLLLLYHCPALAQHIDRVLPGWEMPAEEVTSTQVSIFHVFCSGHLSVSGVNYMCSGC